MPSIPSTPSFRRARFAIEGHGDQRGSIRTLPELVEFNAENNPKHLFCLQANKIGEPTSITHLQLKHAILRCSSWLRDHVSGFREPEMRDDGKVLRAAPIALFMESDVGVFVFFLSLMAAGVPVLLLSARLSPPAVNRLLSDSNASSILTSPKLARTAKEALSLSDLPLPSLPTLCEVGSYLQFLEPLQEGLDVALKDGICSNNHYINEKDCNVVVLHSSGTTGLPKPMYHAHEYLMRYAGCHEFQIGPESESWNASTLPLYHGFGLVAPILSLSVGKTLCLPASSSVPTGASTIEAIQASRACSLMTVPSILDDICNTGNIQHLTHLQFVGFGGGLLKQSVGEKLVAAGVKLVNTFGTTETGPLSPMFVPNIEYDWRYFRLRRDLDLRIEQHPCISGEVQKFKLSVYLSEKNEYFELQDLLIRNPGSSQLDYTTVGRNDDLLVLATGEKVAPAILENLLTESDIVKSAVAFGEGQVEIGVIVEPAESISQSQQQLFKSSLWPIILKAGKQMDAHARLSSKSAIIILTAGMQMPRTDKGSIARKEVYQKFAPEIAKAYHDLENSIPDDSLPVLNLRHPEQDLKDLVQSHLDWKIPAEEWTYDDDFFEMGMDSLQAIRLRRYLIACIPDSRDMSLAESMPRDFVYRHPSIRQIAEALKDPQGLMCVPVSQQAQIEEFVNLYTLRNLDSDHERPSGSVVLLTGSTGSLGSHLVMHLVNLPSVGRVICLNRIDKASKKDPQQQQLRTMKEKRLQIPDHLWPKIQLIQTESSKPLLGLARPVYEELCAHTTHIIHNAWPMDFNRKLPSFKSQFQTVQNLISFARTTHATKPTNRPKILLLSSIAVVGQYGLDHGGRVVPEIPIDDVKHTAPIGYGAAKLVCERLIGNAVRDFGNEIEASYVRIGQMSGSRKTGFWNSGEHLPALIKSSQRIGRLPRLDGTFSWIPVDDAAQVLSEILLTRRPIGMVLHLENPVRQSWHDALAVLGPQINLSVTRSLSFDEWLDQVSVASETTPGDNPAKTLADFFRAEFERMSTGKVILATDRARAASPTLQRLEEIDTESIAAYCRYWRSIGFIH